MREPTTKFKQGSFIAKSASLSSTNAGGVCSVLVAEWLSAGGSLEAASFSHRGRGAKTSSRIAQGMSNDRMTTLNEYGLFSAGGGPGTVSMGQFEAWRAAVRETGYIYYVKLSNAQEGHAIGVVNKANRIRVFDPNHGEWECSSLPDLELILMEIAVDYMEKYDFDSVEVAKLLTPSLSVLAAAVTS
jgi:hypothetical protein